VIPKILATNAAKDATDLVAKLRTYHNHAQKRPDKKHLAQVRRVELTSPVLSRCCDTVRCARTTAMRRSGRTRSMPS
jgi:chaperonin GroEL (HSP60 family)